MARASYKNAIAWVAFNDDTEFLKDAEPIPSVSVCLVADLFDKPTEKIMHDLVVFKRRQGIE